MPSGLLGIEVGGEEGLCITAEAGVATVDEVFVAVHRGGLQIKPAGQNRLHGAIKWRGMRKRSLASGFEPGGAVGVPESQNALRGAQALDDAIAQKVLNERFAADPYIGGLGDAPLSIMSEECSRFRRHMIREGLSATGLAAADMRGDLAVILEDRYSQISGAQPQGLGHQSERCGVQTVIELDVTVAMQDHAVPRAQVGHNRRQILHEGLLERESIERLLTGGAVDAQACFLRHPASRLCVQIRQITERSNRQKVAFKIFNARLHNAFFSRDGGRTRIDLEAISFGSLRIGALHERIAAAGPSDRALRLSMINRSGTLPNHSNARRCKPSHVATL